MEAHETAPGDPIAFVLGLFCCTHPSGTRCVDAVPEHSWTMKLQKFASCWGHHPPSIFYAECGRHLLMAAENIRGTPADAPAEIPTPSQ